MAPRVSPLLLFGSVGRCTDSHLGPCHLFEGRALPFCTTSSSSGARGFTHIALLAWLRGWNRLGTVRSLHSSMVSQPCMLHWSHPPPPSSPLHPSPNISTAKTRPVQQARRNFVDPPPYSSSPIPRCRAHWHAGAGPHLPHRATVRLFIVHHSQRQHPPHPHSSTMCHVQYATV
jgi:hypothetical protein